MDKVAHFFGVAFVALVVALIFVNVNTGYDGWTYGAAGCIGGIVVALAKETVDFCNNRSFDMGDVAAGVLGAIVATIAAGVLV